ncbi:hypothetical protein [Corallococcus llansteffanensis]|uniref:Uncharacterized protein n=1 Tax=Corallococcus llansteffanensis TaxID=2316731 RepID=A0A3A8NGC9_9BACT|nr:hypothetical protein [Corallococcus llansteffanensis]RKH43318.1 hypothetical protein D7V93_37150 [Corallococcus llansteffanensis]
MHDRVRFALLALLLVAGCGKPAWRVKAVPREDLSLPRLEQSVVLELPPPGSVVPAQLGDGTPVWVSRGAGDKVSVLSAIIPAMDGIPSGAMIRWLPTQRRFTGGFVWDEHGRAVGNEGWDACTSTCPDDDDLPGSARDLDRFQVERLGGAPERIRVGGPIPGVSRRIPRKPLPSWSQEPTQDSTRPMSVARALALPEGTVVSVDAMAVLVSGEAPRVCSRPDHHGCCPPSSPRLYDVDGAPLEPMGPGVDSHGVALFRRYRDGFVQYVVGDDLGPPSAGAFLSVGKPPDFDSWRLTEPPRIPPCEWTFEPSPSNPSPPWPR